MQQEPLYRYPKNPEIIGPFRGLLLEYHDDIKYNEFKEDYAELTFQHPNFYRSKSDKFKTVIYYRYPYDVAVQIDKYQNNTNFKASIFNDKFSRVLRPDILYVETKNSEPVHETVKMLQGAIIHNQEAGIQVKFHSFKQTAYAYEELRKTHCVKFAYKSLVPKTSSLKPIKQNTAQADETLNANTEICEETKLEKEVQCLLDKYKGWTPELKKQFKKALQKGEAKYVQNQNDSEESSDDSETIITPSEVILKLCKMHKEIQLKVQKQ